MPGGQLILRPNPNVDRKKLKPLTKEEQIELAILLEMRANKQEKENCERSLIEFMRHAWKEIGETQTLEINWHHIEIAKKLRQIRTGKIRNLIINIPPRHTKPVSIDEMVLTDIGPIRLGDIKVGDRVLTHRGQYRPVTAVHEQGLLDVIAVETFQGRRAKVAPDHPFLTTRGWVAAGELKTTDILAAVGGDATGSEVVSPSMSTEEARFLGYLIGDGSVKYTGISFTGNEEEILDDFERCAHALGFETKRRTRVGTCTAIGVHSNRSGRLQEFLGGHGLRGSDSYTKRVPAAVLRANNTIISNFVGAYASCDGYFAVKHRNDTRLSHEAKMTTVSEGLARDIQHLCLRIGINTRIRRRVAKLESKRQPGGLYTSFDVGATDETNVSKFKFLPGLCERKKRAIEAATPRSFHTVLHPDPVLSIVGAGKAECRCLTVKEDESFTVNDLAVHNSNLVNIIFPAWLWIQPEAKWGPLSGPHVKILSVSYGSILSEELAVKMRRLVMGEWYQKHWGKQVKILPDQQSRANFGNTAGGERMSSSIEGGLLGRGGNLIICDDPQTRRGADSEMERNASIRGMSDLTTRITDPRTSARILIMQRLHTLDATDWALKNWPEDTVHLMYPARFDPDRACQGDPRTERGELLWPAVWTDSALKQIEQGLRALDGDRLTEYSVAGQLQQLPIPKGGGIIKAEWLEPWPPLLPDGTFPQDMIRNGRIQYPALEYVVAWVDTAFTERQQNDRSAMLVFGVFRAEGKGRIVPNGDGTYIREADDYGFPKVLLLYGWTKRLELHGPPDELPSGVTAEEWRSPRYREQRQANWGLVEWVNDTCRRYKVEYLGIETQGQGHGLEQELRRLFSDQTWATELKAARGDKWARAHAVQWIFSSHQLYIPMYEDGTRPVWCEPLIEEICLFPRGRHDDTMDACSGALKHLSDIGIFERREAWDKGEEQSMTWPTQRARALPYDL